MGYGELANSFHAPKLSGSFFLFTKLCFPLLRLALVLIFDEFAVCLHLCDTKNKTINAIPVNFKKTTPLSSNIQADVGFIPTDSKPSTFQNF